MPPETASSSERIEWVQPGSEWVQQRFHSSGGANDIQVLGHLLDAMAQESEGLRVGWFAVGCRPALVATPEAPASSYASSSPTVRRSWCELARASLLGWLAVPACGWPASSPALPDLRWVEASGAYEPRKFHLCPANASDQAISPFNLFEYLVHVKSQAGPTAFRKIVQ